ncbi:MAG: hypothetical protein JXB38_11525 [Anaerolineales bacterium]|nr:hypothetical protein [Anaerolineales bacterium]
MTRYKLLLISSAVVLAVLACALPGDERSAVEEAAPAGSGEVLAPTYTPPSVSSEGGEKNYRTDNILFQDDFSDPNSGWDRQSYDVGSTDYGEDGYLISVTAPNQILWANPGQAFKDVSVEVETLWLDGGEDNNLGIICRYQDVENFYALVISSDGYYGIRRALNGSDGLEFIGNNGMQESDVINMNGRNQLRADCIGSTLSLYANGELLMQVEDDVLAYGDVGLIAGTFSAESTDILFKNFVVYLP